MSPIEQFAARKHALDEACRSLGLENVLLTTEAEWDAIEELADQIEGERHDPQ